MQRDVRLQGLSSDHHHALVFARKLEQQVAGNSVDASLIREMTTRFEDMLLPHFRVEEELLVPALLAVGEDSMGQRILSEHRRLQNAVVAASAGDSNKVSEFAALLTAHVRFEEREVFPICEEKVPAEVLDAVGRRVAKP